MGRPSIVSGHTAAAFVVGFAALFAIGLPGPWPLLPGLVLLGIAGWTHTTAAAEDVGLAALCWGSVAVVIAAPLGLIWPIPPAIGLAVAAGIWQRTGPHAALKWLRIGNNDRPALILALASVPLTVAALVTFIVSGRTDIGAATEGLQGLPVWLVILAGVGFVLVNPTVEEVLFRGVLQTALSSATSSATVGVVTQGVLFGAIHRNGVPGGPIGMAMAGTWGIALGVVRHRTTSIHVPWLVHVVANIAIYATVAGLGYRDGILSP